ncbi:MAG TPA: carboxypeptidase regulatory-like domain-containing protein [Pyrinomonadaceae bacterium]
MREKIRQLTFAALMTAFALVALAGGARAQTSRGTVSGLVTDPNGAAVSGAAVKLTNTQTTVTRDTTTNDEGFYRFDAVDLGNHTVTITAPGFGELVKTNVLVNASQTSTVDAQLAIGTQGVTVDVTAEAGAVLQTEAPVRGGNISTRQVTELPVASRNPNLLALTLPGVTSNRTGVGISTFVVNGARGRSNNFLIDGTENNDISVAGQGLQITNPDAVQEVSIQTSNYDAEFGRAGGAVVNTITRSGTNEFHGTLSYFLDSRVDDAITSSESQSASIQQNGLPFGIQNVFAGTFGGPLYLPRFGEGGRALIDGRNRTFFFGAYQEDRTRAVASSVSLVTPTANGRATLRSLFPAGVNPNVDALLAFTGNTVGTGGPFFLALGAAPGSGAASSTTCDANGNAPAGNRPCVEFGTFTLQQPFLNTNKQGQFRIDHQVSDNNQLSARFLFDRTDTPGASPSFPGFGADSVQRYYNFLISDTHVFSPSFTNEVRLAYNRILLAAPLEDPSGPAGTFPRIVFNGTVVSSLGASPTFPQGRTANNYVVQDTVTYIRGNHTFRGGVDFLRQISTQAAPFAPRGVFTYAASPGYNSFGNFVDNFGGGTNGTIQRDFGSAIYHPQLYRTALFFQDRWKASDALTLTLGLRYEYFGVPFNTLLTPAYTGLFNVDPVTFTGPYSQPNQVRPDRNNFAPTLGVAYSPSHTDGLLGAFFGDRKSVIRAGYQIGYDSFFNNIASNAATSSPNLISTLLTSTPTTATPRGFANFSAQGPTTPNLNPRSAQTLLAPDLVNPYYQRWSIGMQRELPYNLVMDISYVGSKGTKLYINEDANPLVRPELRILPAGYTGPTNCTPNTNITAAQATPGFPAGSPCPLTNRLDNIQGGRTVRTNGGSSSYNSGQIEVRRRFSDNFLLTGSYTYSKLLSNADEVFVTGVGFTAPSLFAIPAVFGGERLDRARSQNDRTHRAVFSYVVESPWFRDQRGFVGKVLGGYQISGVTTFESGQPYTVVNGFDADGIGGNNDRPTYNPLGQRGVRAVPTTNAQGGITGYTNPETGQAIDPSTAEFIVNPAYVIGGAQSVVRVGNLGRNTEVSPGINNWNVNFLKRTNVTENVRIEFRTEFFNIFNHPQYLTGSISPFSPLGGFVQTNAATTPAGLFLNPNTSTTDGGGRVIRYQIKLLF